MKNHHQDAVEYLRDEVNAGDGEYSHAEVATLAGAALILERQPCRHQVKAWPEAVRGVCRWCGIAMERHWRITEAALAVLGTDNTEGS